MKVKEFIGKLITNKKAGIAFKVAGGLLGAAGAGILTLVDKKETKETLKQLVKDEFANK